MTESTRKPSARRQENTQTQREQNRTSRQALSRRGAVTRAILAGASPEQLIGLLGRDGAGIPNSVLLDLLSRERPFVQREQRPLPPNLAAVEPFVWDSPFGTMETGSADALPATPFLAEGEKSGRFPTDAAVPADSVFPSDGSAAADSAFPVDAASTGGVAFTVEGGNLGGAGGSGAVGPVPG